MWLCVIDVNFGSTGWIHLFPPINSFESLFLLFSPILSPLDELVLRELASDEVRARCERSAAPMMSSRRTSDLGEVL